MDPEQQHANEEILARLTRIEEGVQLNNGRITALEINVEGLMTYRAEHQEWAESGRDIIQSIQDQSLDQTDSIAQVQEQLTVLTLAAKQTPGNLAHAVARVLDERQTTQDAAKYRALTERFGPQPEEGLNNWRGLQAGARAIGWKIAAVVATLLVTGVLMALWSISLRAPTG